MRKNLQTIKKAFSGQHKCAICQGEFKKYAYMIVDILYCRSCARQRRRYRGEVKTIKIDDREYEYRSQQLRRDVKGKPSAVQIAKEKKVQRITQEAFNKQVRDFVLGKTNSIGGTRP